MTANHALPMSQKQADALRREWALLLKMGYASQWTPAQKMARQEEIATLLLKDKKMSVDWARDGQEGVAKFRDSLPGYYDVVLMDIRMPVLDGYGATAAIRKLPREDAAVVPVVAMTANAFAEDMARAKAAGLSGYVTKPILPQLLYQAVHKALLAAGKAPVSGT